jgi:hypothetical protein
MRDGTAEQICDKSPQGACDGAARELAAGHRVAQPKDSATNRREGRAQSGPKESTNCHEGQRISATNRRDGTAKRIGDELS